MLCRDRCFKGQAGDRLDVAELGGHVWQVDNTPEGIACLVQQMAEMQPELIVVEATGGYQRNGWMHCFMLD
jgi:hypothetical protein